MSAQTRPRSGNVCIGKRDVRFVHHEARERSPAGDDGSGQLSLPVIRVGLAVQRAQEIEIDWIGNDIYILYTKNFSAHSVCHAAKQS